MTGREMAATSGDRTASRRSGWREMPGLAGSVPASSIASSVACTVCDNSVVCEV